MDFIHFCHKLPFFDWWVVKMSFLQKEKLNKIKVFNYQNYSSVINLFYE